MNWLKKVGSYLLGLVGLVGSGLASAAANLPLSVGATVTQVSDNGQAVFDLVFPVVGLFLGLAIVIKLFKRFSNKM